MNKKFLDILVCPFDKVSSLELFQFKAKVKIDTHTTSNNNDGLDNQSTTSNEDQNSQRINETDKSAKSPSVSKTDRESPEIVEEGLLLCRTCLRFYPITEEIPIILPDELRDKKKDLEFLQIWNKSIPDDLLKNLKPWTL